MNFQMNHEPVYYGIGAHYLDYLHLTYRWFYANWSVTNGHDVVLNYGFADHKHEALAAAANSERTKPIQADPARLKTIYDTIRSVQRDQDWQRKTRLHTFRKPDSFWRRLKPGWYIIRSRAQFPLYVSAVRIRRFSAWLVHADVAENMSEILQFIRRVNEAHHIHLTELIVKK